jgi:hypothetical protein
MLIGPMIYVYAPDQIVTAFPYSIDALRRDNPNVSFPRIPSEETLADYNVFPVIEQAVPDYDPGTQNLNQTNPILADGRWLQVWQVSDASAQEIYDRIRTKANYILFWDALMASTVYAAIREQSFASLPMNTLATEFIALMGDAKAGRPREPAIQASINAILATGTFTQGHLDELQAALKTGYLNGIYILP